MHLQAFGCLRVRDPAIPDQPHRLKLELPRKPSSLHDSPPVPSKHLTRCLRNRVQAMKRTLPNMEQLIGHCVRVRNYFVHGPSPGLSPETIYDRAPFLTDTLEFIFAVSDLHSCGWNVDRWAAESFGRSRLKSYLYSYRENYTRLYPPS